MWCLTEDLPADTVNFLSGMNGADLWQLSAKEPLGEPDSTSSEAESAALNAAKKLRIKYDCLDMLLAVSLQSEDSPTLAMAFHSDVCLMRDLLFGDIVHGNEIKQHQASMADNELAARLQHEGDLEIVSLRLAQEEEQRRLDHELARRIENAVESQVSRNIQDHGKDVLTAPPVDPSGDTYETREVTTDDISEITTGPQCAVCLTVCSDAAQLPCGHFMCCMSLKKLCQMALKDSSLLPVSCCKQEVPCEVIRSVLNKDELSIICDRMRTKAATNKMYCPKPSCSNFIDLDPLIHFRDASTIDRQWQCVACGTAICFHCKQFAHDGECENHSEDQLAVLAASQGWKKCIQCRTFVSLKHGCNHITCVCGYEFCYQCEQAWTEPKSCACAMWSRFPLHLLLQCHDIWNHNSKFCDFILRSCFSVNQG